MNKSLSRTRSPIFGETRAQQQQQLFQPQQSISISQQQPQSPSLNLPSQTDNIGGIINSSQMPEKIDNQFQFTSKSMPIVACHYHPGQQIRNFCLSPQCLMPLCPACVPIHQAEHERLGTMGRFETIERCLSQTYLEVSTECNKFVDDLVVISQLSNEIKNSEQIHQQQILEAKKKLYQVIESYFDALARDVDYSTNPGRDSLYKEATTTSQSTIKRWETLVKILEKLNTTKCVRTLIKYHSKEIQEQCDAYHIDNKQFVENQRAQLPGLVFDQSVLYQINQSLQKLVSWNLNLIQVPLIGQSPNKFNQQVQPQTQLQYGQLSPPQDPLRGQIRQIMRPVIAPIQPVFQQLPAPQLLQQVPQYNFAQIAQVPLSGLPLPGQMITNNFNLPGQMVMANGLNQTGQIFANNYTQPGQVIPMAKSSPLYYYPPPSGTYPPMGGQSIYPAQGFQPHIQHPLNSLSSQNPFLISNQPQKYPLSPSSNLDLSFSPKMNY